MQKFNEKFEESVNLVKTIPNFEKNVTTKLPKKYFIPKKIDIYDVSINVIGIDLGTTRCCMGINRNNKIEIVAIENTGGRLLPSFVSFEEEEANCGKTVLERLEKNKAKYTCFDIKLIIGKSFFDVVVDESWPFEIIEENEKVMIKTEDKNGEVLKSPEEISAVLLKHMRDKAVEFQGQDVLEAVITIPAAYNESQKQATLEAAKLAGWENITLLPEPIAASFAYFNNREIPDNSNVLLFDLGGGTLNICLFKIYGNEIVIISDIGDTCLGGRDIDNLLIDYFTRVLEIRHNVFINTKRKYKLMLKCQKLKQNLSQSEIEYLDVNDFDSDIYEKIEFSRFELEKMMAKMIARMRTKINDVLSTANLIHTEIHKVLQVGGGCRMPVVKQMLKNMFKNAEHCVEEHPDEVVAVGAAIYAYHLATICT
uniref:Heat shock protein 70 n=1 Tax=Panagrolaimus sp. ES5 TaxID=591445 RepID=A0AC34F1U2_9BILA